MQNKLVKDRFIVVKDFYKLGSIVLKYDKTQQRLFVGDSNTLRECESSPIQVVILGGAGALEMYSEYAPYTEYSIDQIDEVIDMVLRKDIPGEINVFIPEDPYLKEDNTP